MSNKLGLILIILRAKLRCGRATQSMLQVVDCCFMCEKSGETVDHLLLHLEFCIWPFWVRVGHASTSGGSLCILVREVW